MAQRSSLGDTARETLLRFRAGDSVEQIAASRSLVTGTIYGHLATAIEADEVIELAQLMNAEAQAEVAAAFKRTGWGNIVGARELLGEKYDYGLLRIFRAAANAKKRIIFSRRFSTPAHWFPRQNQSRRS